MKEIAPSTITESTNGKYMQTNRNSDCKLDRYMWIFNYAIKYPRYIICDIEYKGKFLLTNKIQCVALNGKELFDFKIFDILSDN